MFYPMLSLLLKILILNCLSFCITFFKTLYSACYCRFFTSLYFFSFHSAGLQLTHCRSPLL